MPNPILRQPQLTIRTILLTVIGVLTVLIGVLAGHGVIRAAVNLNQIRQLQQVSIVTNYLYNAANHLAVARAATMALYSLGRTDAPELRVTLFEQLTSARALAGENLDAALNILQPAAAGNPDLAAMLDSLNANRTALTTLRQDIDEALEGERGQRDPLLPEKIFNKDTDIIAQIQKIRTIYSKPVSGINAAVTEQMLFKYFMWDITEYASREYAVIGGLIAANRPLTPSMQQELFLWRGRIAQGWEVAYQMAESSGLTTTLSPYLEEAETHYFMTFDMVKDIFYVPGGLQVTADNPYPITVDIWLELALQAIDSLIALKDASLQETQLYVDSLRTRAEKLILANALILASTLLLSFYSGSVIIRRVIRPINSMVEALYREARGEPYVLPPASNRKDEIGKLSHVLDVFQKNSQQIRMTSLELQDRKNHLNAILAAIMDAIVTMDSEGRIQMVNPAGEKMFGYNEAELAGQKINMLMSFAYAREYDNLISHYRETGDSDTITRTREVEARRKDGSIFPADLAIAQMHSNNHLFFVAVLRDVTGRKEAEEERNRYLRDLEISNRELNDFAYVASHDLKEPLRGIHNFSQFLLEDYGEELDAEGRQMLQTLTRLTQQLEEYLNALLQYSRLGRIELSIQETDLNVVVDKAAKLLAIKIQETGTEIRIPEKLPSVVCDQVRIREVFQNLIGNALKYNDKDKKIIEIGCTDDHPLYPGRQVFYVRDNGIGIPSQHLTTIFRIFKRLHKKNAYGGGTGCGLTIVQKIVNQHGGTIWAESEGKDKGSTFYFTLSESAFYGKGKANGTEDSRVHTHH